MEPHHQATIDRVTAHFKNDPHFLGLIVGGSVAKGWGSPTSDIDIMLIATDEEYARRAATNDLFYFDRQFCDYPDGYVDGKIINLQFLREVADMGSEPARAAFYKAFAAFSHNSEIDTLLPRIPIYPEAERETKMRKFYAQLLILTWYVGEAEKRADAYLKMHMVSDLVLFGGRLILAHNRILYPYHKWFLRELAHAPEKPADFMTHLNAVLEKPSRETTQAFTDCISNFREWGVTMPEAVVEFMKNAEWNWRGGQPPLEDW